MKNIASEVEKILDRPPRLNNTNADLDFIEGYQELVDKGWTKPREYTLPTILDRHRETFPERTVRIR